MTLIAVIWLAKIAEYGGVLTLHWPNPAKTLCSSWRFQVLNRVFKQLAETA
jgi:hypothetical protein